MAGKMKRSIVRIVLVTLVLVRRSGVLGASLNCVPGCRCTGIEINCTDADLGQLPDLVNIQGANIVDVSNNRVEELDFEIAWLGIEQLQFLYLNTNSIYLIDDLAFRSLVNLEYVDLSNNYMDLIPDNLFKYNLRLHTLILQGNAFQDNTPRIVSSSLTHLDLSFCKLTTFAEANVRDLPSLTHLNLQVNNLVYLAPEVFSGHDGVFLSLSYNYWACNCSTVKLYKWALHNQPKITIDERCTNKHNNNIKLFNETRAFLYKEKCDIDEKTFGNTPMKNLSLTKTPRTTDTTTNSSLLLDDDADVSSEKADAWIVDAWLIVVAVAFLIVLVAVAIGVVVGVILGRHLHAQNYSRHCRWRRNEPVTPAVYV